MPQHVYSIEEREHPSVIPRYTWIEWRWVCSCGANGKWQAQSPSASGMLWRKHVESAPPNQTGE